MNISKKIIKIIILFVFISCSVENNPILKKDLDEIEFREKPTKNQKKTTINLPKDINGKILIKTPIKQIIQNPLKNSNNNLTEATNNNPKEGLDENPTEGTDNNSREVLDNNPTEGENEEDLAEKPSIINNPSDQSTSSVLEEEIKFSKQFGYNQSKKALENGKLGFAYFDSKKTKLNLINLDKEEKITNEIGEIKDLVNLQLKETKTMNEFMAPDKNNIIIFNNNRYKSIKLFEGGKNSDVYLLENQMDTSEKIILKVFKTNRFKPGELLDSDRESFIPRLNPIKEANEENVFHFALQETALDNSIWYKIYYYKHLPIMVKEAVKEPKILKDLLSNNEFRSKHSNAMVDFLRNISKNNESYSDLNGGNIIWNGVTKQFILVDSGPPTKEKSYGHAFKQNVDNFLSKITLPKDLSKKQTTLAYLKNTFSFSIANFYTAILIIGGNDYNVSMNSDTFKELYTLKQQLKIEKLHPQKPI
ncbi:MAG: hypothetical protein GY830_03380 [Bacteroidetes bacterium]|nr:hypothetical protein [Bacteroidota bacterium]